MNANNKNRDEAVTSDLSYRSMLGQAMALACLLVGLGLTFFLYHYFVQADQERVKERLLRGTQVLASTSSATDVNADVDIAFKLLDDMAFELARNQRIDQAYLEHYLWQPQDAMVEAIGLRYLPWVRFNASSRQYEMRSLSSQWTGFELPILSFNATGVAEPDHSQKDEYFPVLYSAGGKAVTTLTGLNFLSDPSYLVALEHARDTGQQTYRKTFPRPVETEPYLFYITFKPLYYDLPAAPSVGDRRKALVGYLSAVVMIRARSFIEFIPESYQGLHAVFISQPGQFSSDTLNPQIQTLIRDGDYAMARVEHEGPPTTIITKPSFGQISAMQRNDRWWALSIGILLSTWLSTLLLSSSRRSVNMQRLVQERTSALAERSKKLEQVNTALQQSESLYRMVATNVHDIIFSHDAEGVCTYISPSVKSVLGYEVEEIMGHPVFKIMSDKSVARVRASIQRAKENLQGFDDYRVYEHEIFSKQGLLRNMECTISLIADEDGKLSGFLVVSRDVTERIKDQQEKERLKQTIQQSQKMEAIGTLAGGIAHDFNNLLTGILGHAELIKANMQLDESAGNSAGVIVNAALRGKQLTTQLLGFARKGRFQEKQVDINKMITETEQLFERTLGKNINISSRLCSPAPVVLGDPGQISQILLNLAVNARDAMPDGGDLVFRSAIREFSAQDVPLEMKPGIYCEITVSDTGIGIPRHIIDRIFEPFFSGKEEGKGTGLGLAMVYGVVTNHGGKVTVVSEPGKGAVFKIYLPLSNAEVFAQPKDDVQKASGGSGNVMIVDDEKMVRELSEQLLKALGYQAIGFEDPSKAIAYYEQHWQQVDLVIMDLVMPHMGGMECLYRMRRINLNLRALISTGYTPEVIHENLNQDYILGFLQKPFLLKELSEQVRAALKS